MRKTTDRRIDSHSNRNSRNKYSCFDWLNAIVSFRTRVPTNWENRRNAPCSKHEHRWFKSGHDAANRQMYFGIKPNVSSIESQYITHVKTSHHFVLKWKIQRHIVGVVYVLNFQLWKDYQLQWEPSDFGGISVVRILASKVWKPDIVLFNKYVWRRSFKLSWNNEIYLQWVCVPIEVHQQNNRFFLDDLSIRCMVR